MTKSRLAGPEVRARSYDGMLAVAQRVQIAVGAAALLALWLLQGVPARGKLTVTVLLLGLYLPWAVLSPKLGRGAPRLVNIAIDLLAIGVFALVIPETRVVVMIAYVLMLAFHAYVNGRAASLVVAAGILTVVGAAELLAPAAERLDAFTLVMYAVVLVAFTFMLDALAAERRKLVTHLSRLNAALASLTTDPDLSVTINSVARAAEEAVGAAFVVVLMRENGKVGYANDGSGELARLADRDDVAQAFDTILHAPMTTPSGAAMETGEVVTIGDITTDERFSHYAAIAEQTGFRSLVAIPLLVPEGALGTLNAYWAAANAFDGEDVALLTAYARQAVVALARALAFDREREAAAHLAEADRVKSEFVARVSHELRTPLTAINGFVSTILLHWDQIGDAEKRDLLERAGWNASELRRLVEQVLAFARTGDTGGQLMIAPLSLAAEIGALVGHLLPALGDHRVDVDVHPSVVVRADREALHHVLTNLLVNAAKFSPAATTIEVVARRLGREVQVSVRDDGPGIEAHEHARIFERFYRSSSVSERGTGIGLSIVQSFVEQMGGRVWVESTPGEGATFSFTLPAGLAEADRPPLERV